MSIEKNWGKSPTVMQTFGPEPIHPLQDTWPKFNGHIVGLKYVPEHRLKGHLKEWKAWMQKYPNRRDWPYHLTDFIDDCKRKGIKIDLDDTAYNAAINEINGRE